MEARGWSSGRHPQSNQSCQSKTREDWSLPTAACVNADTPEDAYASELAGNILTNSQAFEQNDQQHFCTLPCGPSSCVHLSQDYTPDQTMSQPSAYAAYGNAPRAHSDVGVQALFDGGGVQFPGPADRAERRRPSSAPPSVRCYIQVRQSHEELACSLSPCGMCPSNIEQRQARRLQMIALAISNFEQGPENTGSS
ncbi:hypothetical protein PG994_013082 [Apiospora phragmitis]|uniref:Uncharacterized protein n=1 Tax=Apiospora phragmitis TaxID=2905665 RepID=A0ABR1T7M6_9PEZI